MEMIYTVTFNPSLDYIVSVNDFQLGLTNRTDSELILPGGKGINVSTILMNLGIDSTAFGFAAGFTGEEIIREVEAMGSKSLRHITGKIKFLLNENHRIFAGLFCFFVLLHDKFRISIGAFFHFI